MLSGQFQHNMDKKGRVFIPAKFRDELGGKVVLCKSLDVKNCLCIYTLTEYQRIMKKIGENKLVIRNKFLRYLSSSVELEYDAQGRITVPQTLREFGKLSDENPIMIIGTTDKVEVWSKPLWDEENVDGFADELSELLNEVDL